MHKLSHGNYTTRYKTKEELDQLRLQREVDQQPNAQMKSPVLSSIEETLLLSFYQKEAVGHFINNSSGSFPISVYSSACYFSRAFYLKSSIYKYDPLFICFLCFYTAAKVEHHYMSISSYLKMLPASFRCYREEFVMKEVEVLRNINFDLNHSSVFDAIDGLLMQYEFYMNNKASVVEKDSSPYFTVEKQPVENSKNLYISELRAKARSKAFFVITTDLILIHPSSQLAAAILIDDLGSDILCNMLRCFMDNRDGDFTEKHVNNYSNKILCVKEAIGQTEKLYYVDWNELVARFNNIVTETSKD